MQVVPPEISADQLPDGYPVQVSVGAAGAPESVVNDAVIQDPYSVPS